MIETRHVSSRSAYEELEKELRRKILRNELESDRAITTETELARRYGISRNTARKALANLEHDGLLRRVQGRGTFVVPPDERPKHAPVKRRILLAITDYRHMSPTNAYDRNLISGCLEQAFVGHAELMLADPDDLSPKDLLNDFNASRLHGIIWERPLKGQYSLIEEMRDAGIPQVTISRSIVGVPCVFFDVERSLAETMEFLAGIGHHEIAFLDLDMDYPIFRNRQRAFLETLRRMGHTLPEHYLYLPVLKSNYDTGLDALPPVTAVIVSSVFVDHFQSWAQRRGIAIPRDVSLISLSSENSSELERFPETSAIIDPRREIGKTAVDILGDVIAGREVPTAPRKIRGELVVRKSCLSPSARISSSDRNSHFSSSSSV